MSPQQMPGIFRLMCPMALRVLPNHIVFVPQGMVREIHQAIWLPQRGGGRLLSLKLKGHWMHTSKVYYADASS